MNEHRHLSPWGSGKVHVYTGDGKGKTTAALGLALRAVGAGARVFVGQFLKGKQVSELEAFARLGDAVTVRQYGREQFVPTSPAEEDRCLAQEGLADARKIIAGGSYALVILDEINQAVDMQLVSAEDVVALIADKPQQVELVLTGRNADARFVECADIVTEMRAVKHYYDKGVEARKGIEF